MMFKILSKICIALFSIAMIYACDEESYDVVNFNDEYSFATTDSAAFFVASGSEDIQMSAFIDGKDGLIEITVVSPDSVISYQEEFSGYGTFSVNETLSREEGSWWIYTQYESVEGNTPSGEFSITLEY